ncbi:uncharacterized protein KY384_009231 [Bacidia gigantensis]|uniref:uncharacterized protein n=1 Tax=Bacidia gigantensis TaxID=2732470 RepID=UPI001D0382DD|nr:uncharacterized protein KY384_009231 [Bacidia gigantensis]KAG8525587.1 hypothetical protein KY384_009231 [Bacidia gigantensis]
MYLVCLVPFSPETSRKLETLAVTLLGPEITIGYAVQNWLAARAFLKRVHSSGNRDWTMTHAFFAVAGGFTVRMPDKDDYRVKHTTLQRLIVDGCVDRLPIFKAELQSRGKSDWVVKIIALFQICWFAVQTLFRAIQHLHVTAVEIMTIAFIFCSVFIYGLYWHHNRDVEYPVIIEVRSLTAASGEITPTQQTRTLEDIKSIETDFLESVGKDNGLLFRWLSTEIAACAFGAVHCLAWSSLFPTPQERLAWRICAVATLILPLLFSVFGLIPYWYLESFWREDCYEHSLWAWACFYVAGRLAIIVLALMELRSLPSSALETVQWSKYVPHFGP